MRSFPSCEPVGCCTHAKLGSVCLTLYDPMEPTGLLSMGLSRGEHWSELPFSPPGHLPNPGMKPSSLMSPAVVAGSLPLTPPGKPITPNCCFLTCIQVSQEADRVVSYSQVVKNFPVCCDPHSKKL